MADGLAVLGIKHEVMPDGICIEGMGELGSFGQGVINSHGDHRIAMAFTMAALRANGPIRILDCNNVATSFPGFADLARSCGIGLQAGTGI